MPSGQNIICYKRCLQPPCQRSSITSRTHTRRASNDTRSQHEDGTIPYGDAIRQPNDASKRCTSEACLNKIEMAYALDHPIGSGGNPFLRAHIHHADDKRIQDSKQPESARDEAKQKGKDDGAKRKPLAVMLCTGRGEVTYPYANTRE
ncbi:MAG: hypothetical protein Q9199_002293 [Rusavskia elegans]